MTNQLDSIRLNRKEYDTEQSIQRSCPAKAGHAVYAGRRIAHIRLQNLPFFAHNNSILLSKKN